MGINSDFKKSLSTTADIILHLTLILDDIKYFNESKTKKQNIILIAYRFLWRAHYGIYVAMVLYYNKLFIGEEDPSLIKLLNVAVNHYKGLKWIKKPDLKQLQIYLDSLKECESSSLIQNLKVARDTYYAHFDKKRPTSIPIESDDLDKYLSFAQEIVNYLLLHYENRQYHFSFSDIDVGHHIIDNLFKYRQIKMALIHSKLTLDKVLTIDQIRDIVNSK
jgi:hypothetical protein